MKGGEKKRNVVSIRITDDEQAKLDNFAKTFDRPYAWIFRRLLSAATVEQIRDTFGGIKK
jgi:predicted transcriptional regulator